MGERPANSTNLKLQLNVPNSLTAARVVLSLGCALLLLHQTSLTRFLAGLMLSVAWGTDWLDGYLARRLNQVTLGGAIFDLLADRLLMTGISIFTVVLGFWGSLSWMPWTPFSYLIVVWSADLALLIGIAVFTHKRRQMVIEFPSPPLAAKLAFPVQMLTLELAVFGIGSQWLLVGFMYLTIISTAIAAYAYLKKGFYVFTSR
jgi:phosphatidylglycerophosphate synthase